MMWMLIGLATIELVVVHLLVAHWWPTIAIALSLATLPAIGWLLWVVASFRRLPVQVSADRVVLRVGRLRSVALPHDAIIGVRLDGWTAAEVKARTTLNLALVAWPNIVVDLVAPLPGRRGIVAVAHRLDDPAGFAATIERLGAGA